MNPDKKKSIDSLFLSVVLLIALSFPVCATAGRGDPARFRFRRISVEDGLSQSTVNKIYQDSKGFMWIGTDQGLNKYDGKKITVFSCIPHDKTSLSYPLVSSITEDSNGTMWISAGQGQLNKWNALTGTFTRFHHEPGNPKSLRNANILKILPAPGGRIWIIFRDQTLVLFEPGKGVIRTFKHQPDTPGSLGDGIIADAVYDRSGRFWVATYGSGLNLYHPDTHTFTLFTREKESQLTLYFNKFSCMCSANDGSLWLAANDSGLVKFDTENHTFRTYPHALINTKTNRAYLYYIILQDRDGLVWMGTWGKGLVLFNPSDESFTDIDAAPRKPEGLTGEFVLELYEDRSGVLWIGTRKGGVSILPRYRDKFRHYYERPGGLSGDHINCFYQDHNGALWIGTEGRGLNKWDRKTETFTIYRNSTERKNLISGNFVASLAEAPAGALWIAFKGAGLDRLDLKTNAVTQYRKLQNSKPGTTISHNYVSELMALTPTKLWIGTPMGIDRLDVDTGKFTHLQLVNDPPTSNRPIGIDQRNFVSCFYRGKSGVLWVGTYKGLYRYHPANDNFTCYSADSHNRDSIQCDRVFALCEDDTGHLWIGTRYGLIKYDEKLRSFSLYTVNDGLPNNMIYGILPDRNGNLWLSTNKGLASFNPASMVFTCYGPDSGLQDFEFNSNAYHVSPSGEMFFGGIRGFNVFNPDEIQFNPHRPPVEITGFELFNIPVKPGPGSPLDVHIGYTRELFLSYNQNICSFTFAALDFNSPAQNRYKYKMEGLNDRWIPLGHHNRINFAGLEPGNYTLHVKATNNDGIWSENAASIKINITPPFYSTLWFRILVLLAAGFLVFLWHQNRVKHLRLQIHTRNQLERICDKYNLSKREREVIDLVLKGKTNKEIEDELFISIRTVKAHIYNSFKKFGVQSRLELINFIQRGTASPQKPASRNPGNEPPSV